MVRQTRKKDSFRLRKRKLFRGSVAMKAFVGLAVILGLGVIVSMVFREPFQKVETQIVEPIASYSLDSNLPKDWVVVGGIARPKSDVAFSESNSAAMPQIPDYGLQPDVDPNSNPGTQSVYEALASADAPERLSPFLPAKPFDEDRFSENPKEYLNIVEPSRVWQSAQPGPNIPVLVPKSETYQQMKQGEVVALKVLTLPGKPVTFTSFDLGAFQNDLNSISVAADESGIATANFSAPPGTIAQVNVLAASPVASSNVRFSIFVSLVEN